MSYSRAFQKWWEYTALYNASHHLENWQYQQVKVQCFNAWKAGRRYQMEREAEKGLPTGAIDPFEVTITKGQGRDVLCARIQMMLCCMPVRIQPGTWHVALKRLPKEKTNDSTTEVQSSNG